MDSEKEDGDETNKKTNSEGNFNYIIILVEKFDYCFIIILLIVLIIFE